MNSSININGCKIAYLAIGSGENKVIFLHGNNEDHKIFAKMLNKFDLTKTTAYLIDTRGHGESEYKGEISIEQFSDDVLEFIDKLSLEKVNIVGYSDGANIALKVADKNQAVINKMVLISGNLTPDAIHIQEKGRIKTIYYLTYLWQISKKIRRLHKLQKLMLTDYGIGIENLQKIKAPTLVIGAENDIINHNHTKLIAEKLDCGIAIFTPKTTHFNLIDNDHTATEVEKFVK